MKRRFFLLKTVGFYLIIYLLPYLCLFLFRNMSPTGFTLALAFFDSLELSTWFREICYVPSVFINVLHHFDKELIKSLASVNKTKPRRNCYTYLIFNYDKFVSLVRRHSGVSIWADTVDFGEFVIFMECVEYAGKATNARCDDHFRCAIKVCQGLLSLNAVSGQVGFIYDCWKNGGGVMCLQLENGSTSLEAHCREAAIISCLGLGQLQNKVNGSKYGQMKSWSDVKLKNFGLLTLYISFMKFVIKRPPVIRASDVPFHVGTRKCSKKYVCEVCGNILQ